MFALAGCWQRRSACWGARGAGSRYRRLCWFLMLAGSCWVCFGQKCSSKHLHSLLGWEGGSRGGPGLTVLPRCRQQDAACPEPSQGCAMQVGCAGAEQRGGGGSCTTSSPSPQKYSRGSGLMGAAGHVPRCGAEHLAAVSSPASRVTRLSLCQADRCKV